MAGGASAFGQHVIPLAGPLVLDPRVNVFCSLTSGDDRCSGSLGEALRVGRLARSHARAFVQARVAAAGVLGRELFWTAAFDAGWRSRFATIKLGWTRTLNSPAH